MGYKPYARVMKILLADPHPEVQSALRLMLERIPAITAIDEAGSLAALLSQCAQACPDLILFDPEIAAPSRSRQQPLVELICGFRRLCPAARVVVISSRFEARRAAQDAGADGFISKTDPPDAVLAGILHFFENHSTGQI
jgi:DNA-binding NarL/FixJ family response regulator